MEPDLQTHPMRGSRPAAFNPHDIIPPVKIGEIAPGFALPDLDGRSHRLQDFRGQIAIVNFWSCECPHSARTDALLTAWIASWGERVALLSIASNANESSDMIKAAALERRLPLALLDNHHAVADLYEAQITPQVFVVDAQGVLRYEGAVDDVNFGNRHPGHYFLQEVVQAILDGASPSIIMTQPYGCIIVRHALE